MKQRQADFLARYLLQTFAAIFILGVLIRTFVISSFAMSGMSMLPNVWPGDFLAGAKWRTHDLKRGEIVVLRCPNTQDQICLRRVIGLAGDRIEFKNGILTINGEVAQLTTKGPSLTLENVAGQSWLTWPGILEGQTAEATVVPPQHVYLLNDRRSYSDDSRLWGPIKTDLIEARALKVWLSLDWWNGQEVRSWPRVRWPRLLRSMN